jgi:hypothetical protein
MLKFSTETNDSFMMSPYTYNVQNNKSANKSPNVVRSSKADESIILPTPSSGLTLTESGQWEDVAGLIDLGKGISQGVSKKVLEMTGPVMEHAQKGMFLNDYSSLAYRGSDFRQYSFSWTLIPKSEKESRIIADIIRTIRKNTLPDYYTSNGFVKYPNMWAIFPTLNDKLEFYLQDCVITNFSVNYSPESILRTYKSGYPVSVEFSIEVKELYRANVNDI